MHHTNNDFCINDLRPSITKEAEVTEILVEISQKLQYCNVIKKKL